MVMSDFREVAVRVSREIVDDITLPVHVRRHKPDPRFGGIAGGEKYYSDGILYKFARDVRGLYGGHEWAGKAADNELRGLNQVLNLDIPRLKIPLMAIVDYRGHRVVAVSTLKISKQSLVYGTSDAGNTLHDAEGYPDIREVLEQMGKDLGLAPHPVVERSTGKVTSNIFPRLLMGNCFLVRISLLCCNV